MNDFILKQEEKCADRYVIVKCCLVISAVVEVYLRGHNLCILFVCMGEKKVSGEGEREIVCR